MTTRKPDHLKAIAGTSREDRAAPERGIITLAAIEQVPPPPDFLPNGHAVAEWRRLAPVMVANRLLTAGNLHALALLCGLHGRVLQLWSASEAPPAALVGQIRGLLAELGLSTLRLPVKPPPSNRFAGHGKPPEGASRPGEGGQ